MKLNFKVFKKGSPLLWIGGAVVLFVVFYMLSSKGSNSSNGGNVYTTASGPSDASVAAATQLSMAQLQANVSANQMATELAAVKEQTAGEIALANIGANVAFAGLAADQNVQLAALNTQKSIAEMNTEYAIESAEIAAEVNLATVGIQRDMFAKQLDTNVTMLDIQSRNLISQSLISQVGSLKKKDRDQALTALAGVNYRGQIAAPNSGLLERV